jgi:hypothetical protein
MLLRGNTGTNWLRPSLADELLALGQPLDAAEYFRENRRWWAHHTCVRCRIREAPAAAFFNTIGATGQSGARFRREFAGPFTTRSLFEALAHPGKSAGDPGDGGGSLWRSLAQRQHVKVCSAGEFNR